MNVVRHRSPAAFLTTDRGIAIIVAIANGRPLNSCLRQRLALVLQAGGAGLVEQKVRRHHEFLLKRSAVRISPELLERSLAEALAVQPAFAS